MILNEDKPFKCEFCDEQFAVNYELMYHYELMFSHNTAETEGRPGVQGVGNERPFVSSNKPFLVKPYGCGICGEMFEMETDCVEHCYQVCYFPVEDDFALFFEDEHQNRTNLLLQAENKTTLNGKLA